MLLVSFSSFPLFNLKHLNLLRPFHLASYDIWNGLPYLVSAPPPHIAGILKALNLSLFLSKLNTLYHVYSVVVPLFPKVTHHFKENDAVIKHSIAF